MTGRALAVAGVGAVAAMSMTVAPSPASAETTPGVVERAERPDSSAAGVIATTDGVAGMTQSVSVLAPEEAGSTISLSAAQGQLVQTFQVSLNRLGIGQVRWAPPSSGTWTVSAAGAMDLTPATSRTTTMPTRTQVAVPTNPTQHRYSPFIATVEPGDRLADAAAREIEGTVVFREVVRGEIGRAKVEMTSDGTALARLEWIPPGVATYGVTAEFVPAVDARSGSAVFASSTSELAYFTAGIDPRPVQLLMPQTLRVGYPAYVVVRVEDGHSGQVSLMVNGARISPDRPVEGGIVSFPWIPTAAGVADVQVVFHEVGVEHSSSEVDIDGIREYVERITLSHVVEQSVEVLEALPRNPISVSPVVKGVAQMPWGEDEVVEYSAGTRVRLVTSTGNGAPVVFMTSGSCAVAGSTLYLPLTGGGCSIRFTSPGGGGYAANQARVTVSAVLR